MPKTERRPEIHRIMVAQGDVDTEYGTMGAAEGGTIRDYVPQVIVVGNRYADELMT